LANGIVAAIHPKVILKLLDKDVVRESHRRRIQGLQETEGVVAVQVQVDAAAHPVMNHNIYRLNRDEMVLFMTECFIRCKAQIPPMLICFLLLQNLYTAIGTDGKYIYR